MAIAHFNYIPLEKTSWTDWLIEPKENDDKTLIPKIPDMDGFLAAEFQKKTCFSNWKKPNGDSAREMLISQA